MSKVALQAQTNQPLCPSVETTGATTEGDLDKLTSDRIYLTDFGAEVLLTQKTRSQILTP